MLGIQDVCFVIQFQLISCNLGRQLIVNRSKDKKLLQLDKTAVIWKGYEQISRLLKYIC